MSKPAVSAFHDARTGSVQYVVADPQTRRCAIIDPVLDFDEKSGSTATTNADAILQHIRDRELVVEWILDTHPHADHLSAARYLSEKTGAPTAMGEHVRRVQAIWKEIYDWEALPCDGSCWDQLFSHGDSFPIGRLQARVLHSPGHTLASVTYLIGDAAFIHDTLFMPDSGSARADFPGGSAADLWTSIQEILALSEDTRLFTGHDYRPGGRPAQWQSTIAEQREFNAHLRCRSASEFIALREARDRSLPMPKLILPALQVNILGGRLPAEDASGKRYLKIPLNAFPSAVW